MSIFREKFPIIDINNEIVMREPTTSEADYRKIFQIYSNPLVNQFIPDNCVPRNIEDARKECIHYSNVFHLHNGVYWFIALKKSDEVIGTCGFCDWNKYHRRLEIAYNIDPNYWNQGIASAAVEIATKFAFEKMDAMRVQANLDPSNIASRKIMFKHGYSHEGTLKSYRLYKHGKHIDVEMFGIDRDTFISYNSKSKI